MFSFKILLRVPLQVCVCEHAEAVKSLYDVFLSPYRLHLLGDGGYLLDFGPQLISLLVHHLLQLQHHLSLLVLDMVCRHTQIHKHTQCQVKKTVALKKKIFFCEYFFCPSLPLLAVNFVMN